MSSLTDAILLLTKLVSNLRRSDVSTTINDDDVLSSLATSLNFGDQMTPRVRVLDPALSLMCFKTPEVFLLLFFSFFGCFLEPFYFQVCSARIECLVRTILSVLNSSNACKVLRSEEGGGAEFLKVGSSISSRDCHRLIRVCGDVLESLEGRGGHSETLLYAILKAVVSSSSYQSLLPLSPLVYEENEGTPCDRRAEISKLMCFLPKESSSNSHEIPMRTMLMDFPAWFYFATALIFHRNDSQDYISRVIGGEVKTETVNNEELHQAAALYLSWILCPIDEAHRGMLFDQISELSRSWTMKNKESCSYEQQSCSDIHYEFKLNCTKKLRIPKPSDYDKLHATAQEDRASTVRLWLQKFDRCCVNYCARTTNSHIATEAKSKQETSMYPNLLSVKIPLGIFITSPSYINEKGCELLLHYAANGEIEQVKEMQWKAKDCVDHDEFTPWSAGDARKWALNGACLVFNLLDLIEDMSVMLFDREDTRVDFLRQMKGKASRYLLKCVKLLFECECLEFYNGAIGVRDNVLDLYRRLVKWRQQGPEGFEGYKAFDDVVDDFAKRFRIVK